MAQQVVIKFNIGGTRYEVSQSLLQSYPDSMLAKSAAEQWHTDSNAEIFIDRDGERFRYVLDYLRDGQVHLPVVVTKASFLIDLKFYAVDIKEDAIVEKLDASHFTKYVPLVRDVMNSWEQEKIVLDNRKNILEDCITIMLCVPSRLWDWQSRYCKKGDTDLLAVCDRRSGLSFKDCNEELRKVGLRVEKEEVRGGPVNLVYDLSLAFVK